MMAVVTNIDADHLATYNDNFTKLRNTFIEFLHHLPFYGLAVLCNDDSQVRHILTKIDRPIITYGFLASSNYRASIWQQNNLISSFKVERPKPYSPLYIKLKLPGRHNVLNALAAIAIATELGVHDEAIVNGLLKFQGVGRRFQILGTQKFAHGSAIVIDDYGHHPQEIIATINACRQVWPEKRLIHVFQPHRYTRTQDLFNQFVNALSLSDLLLMLDIYAAGEQPIPGLCSALLVDEIRERQQNAFVTAEKNLTQKLNQFVMEGDLVLLQGAGSIGQLAANLILNQANVAGSLNENC